MLFRKFRELFRRRQIAFGAATRRSDRSGHQFVIELLEERALLTGTSGTPQIGVLLLEPSAKLALYNTGSGGVQVTGGVLAINSTNRSAAMNTGKGNVTADLIDVTGGLVRKGLGRFQGQIIQPPGAAPIADPLASLPEPEPDYYYTNATVNATGSTSLTLWPGTYVGGIHLRDHANVTLEPGTYYLKGGGLSVIGDATLTGEGVTIFNAPTNRWDNISFLGRSTVNLTAGNTSSIVQNIFDPTARNDDLYNVVLFQERTSSVPIVISSGNVTLSGTVYAPHAAVSFTGNRNLNIIGNRSAGLIGQLVAARLECGGSGRLNVEASPWQRRSFCQRR